MSYYTKSCRSQGSKGCCRDYQSSICNLTDYVRYGTAMFPGLISNNRRVFVYVSCDNAGRIRFRSPRSGQCGSRECLDPALVTRVPTLRPRSAQCRFAAGGSRRGRMERIRCMLIAVRIAGLIASLSLHPVRLVHGGLRCVVFESFRQAHSSQLIKQLRCHLFSIAF